MSIVQATRDYGYFHWSCLKIENISVFGSCVQFFLGLAHCPVVPVPVSTQSPLMTCCSPTPQACSWRKTLETNSYPTLLSLCKAAVQVQKAFAQILLPFLQRSSVDTINRDSMERAKNLLLGCISDQCTHSSAFIKGADAAVFLKGMEEGSRFLQRDNGFRKDQQVNQVLKLCCAFLIISTLC